MLAAQLAWPARARGAAPSSPPGRTPSVRQPWSTHSCMTCQRCSSPVAHLGLGAPRQLVREHDAADRQARLRAAREQLVAGGERVAAPGCRRARSGLADRVLVDHEAAADRVVVALRAAAPRPRPARRGAGREAHAVRVEGQRLVRRCRTRSVSTVARDLVRARQAQPAGGATSSSRASAAPGVDGLGGLALQPEHHGLDGAVAVAGGAERAEQLGPHPPDRRAGRRPQPSAKVRAARIGPTVCELDGPMPTEKRSNALRAITAQCVRSCGHPGVAPRASVQDVTVAR